MKTYWYTRLSETLSQLKYILEYLENDMITYEEYTIIASSIQYLIVIIIQAIKKDYGVDVVLNLETYTFSILDKNIC